MCLAVPGKIIRLQGDRGVASLHGNEVPISTVLVPALAVGDWVLVHAGFAIQQIEEEAATETFRILSDLQRSATGVRTEARHADH